MPARLREDEDADELVLKLGGQGNEFSDQLAKVKEMSGVGKRYDGGTKTWRFPNDPDALMAVVHSVEPELSAELAARVKKAAAEIAGDLITRLPDDAALSIPWRERLTPKQRAGVDFIAEHPRTLLCDEMGGGKTIEAISSVYESLLRARITLDDDQTVRKLSEATTNEPILAGQQAPGQIPGVLQGLSTSGTGEAARGRNEIAAEIQGTALRGLWDSASARVYGPGSHQAEAVRSDEPGVLPQDDEGRDRTVRASLSELSSVEALPRGRFLVVCPNSVTGVWMRELSNWVGVGGIVIDGKTPEKRAEQLDGATDWVIINWEKLQKSVGLLPLLEKINWDAVIADEAHRAKNRKAQKTKGLWKLRAPMQIAATGTPIMNDPGELWSLLRWLRPQQYTSYWKFFYDYCDFYNGYKGKKMVKGVRNADALRFELADKMVRRTKREIHKGIPKPFPPSVRVIPMKPAQQKLYDEALKEFWLDVIQAASESDDPSLMPEHVEDIMNAGDLESVKMLIPNAAARLVRCRQIATSPAVLGGPDESGKLDAVMDTITDAEDGRPFVVFAWYRPTVQLILDRLEHAKISARGFTGDTPAKDRTALAAEFQDGKFDVIVATIATGGEGIDLFRSSDVLMVEEDWVPAKNQQAIDRCDRMGQQNPVQAQFFRSADSVETGKLAPKLATKTLITTTILGATA
jgi:SNF2 family DNA or RNA helicase